MTAPKHIRENVMNYLPGKWRVGCGEPPWPPGETGVHRGCGHPTARPTSTVAARAAAREARYSKATNFPGDVRVYRPPWRGVLRFVTSALLPPAKRRMWPAVPTSQTRHGSSNTTSRPHNSGNSVSGACGSVTNSTSRNSPTAMGEYSRMAPAKNIRSRCSDVH